MARRVAEVFCEHRGDMARSLDGTSPDEHRKRVYKAHQNGEFQVLSVCGLCREGYNDPGIAAVAVFRPTKSRSLAEQMKGRGCRPLRGLVDGLPDAAARLAAIAASAKPDCLIVDLVGITGMPPVTSTAEILAGGLPDEVVDRANKAAQEKDAAGEDVDLQEELRRAKLQGEVRYSSHEVEQGGGGTHSKSEWQGKPEDRPWPWGQHRGTPLGELPRWFLDWAARKAKGKAMLWAGEELARRNARQDTSGGAQRTLTMPDGPVTDGQRGLLRRHGLTATTFGEAAQLIAQATSHRREVQHA
jgi:hypothetical protein